MKTSRLFGIAGIAAIIALFGVSPSFAEIQNVCAGQIPAGWIAINDSWSPSTCGNPTAIVYTVVTIERIDNKPQGTQMQVCVGPVPPGWIMISSGWNPTVCGHPTSISNNVMTIRKVN